MWNGAARPIALDELSTVTVARPCVEEREDQQLRGAAFELAIEGAGVDT